MTRKVVQNTRPSFVHVRGGTGHETISFICTGLKPRLFVLDSSKTNFRTESSGSRSPAYVFTNCEKPYGMVVSGWCRLVGLLKSLYRMRLDSLNSLLR